MSENRKNNGFGMSFLIRIILGGLFIYAAAPKIFNPLEFALTIENYQIVSPLLSHYSALFLPWLELYCGILIIINYRVPFAAGVVAVLLLVFIPALISVIVRGLEIDCGCFSLGNSGSAVSWLRIFEDIIMLGMAAYLVFTNEIKERFK